LAKFSRFDGVYSQLVKRLGKIFFGGIRKYPILLGNGNKKNFVLFNLEYYCICR
jgi:hypothetical protein